MTITNRRFVLASRPTAAPREDNFRLETAAVPELAPGQVLVRHRYLSLDPYMRGRMSDQKSYAPPQPLGEVMVGGTAGEVVASKSEKFAVGDTVVGMGGWQDYAVVTVDGPTSSLRKVDATRIPLSAYLGAVGMPGVTAWYGLHMICEPKAGETVAVSAASGAVGGIVGQLAKAKGCRVVGIAGSPEKCKWVTDDLGFDTCIDYKTENVAARLKQTCPKGIDVYFDNVGGEILDAVLAHISLHARIVLCGAISMYNATEFPPGPKNYVSLIVQRGRMEGFIVTDFMPRFPEAFMQISQWISEGKIKYAVDVVQGLENATTAINRLFTGANTGKLLVQISEEPA